MYTIYADKLYSDTKEALNPELTVVDISYIKYIKGIKNLINSNYDKKIKRLVNLLRTTRANPPFLKKGDR